MGQTQSAVIQREAIIDQKFVIKIKLQKMESCLISTPNLKQNFAIDLLILKSTQSYRFLGLTEALPLIADQFREVR